MEFGVIGCGRISQMMHLPYLAEIPEASIAAIADPARNVRAATGDRYSIAERFESGRALLGEVGDELDAVVVATPPHDHAEAGVAALAAGLDTLVEKPLALALDEADRLVAAAEESDATAMVGYMKRHDPTYLCMQERVEALPSVSTVTATVRYGQYDTPGEVYDLVAPELPDEFVAESEERRKRRQREASGASDPALASAYESALSTYCHDVNALKGLLGDVVEVEYATLYDEARALSTVLRFEGGTRCVFTANEMQRNDWEEQIRVDAQDETLVIEFSNPYIRNSPFAVTIKQGERTVEQRRVSTSRKESFKHELEHFIDCAREGRTPRTTFPEARADLATFIDVFRAATADER